MRIRLENKMDKESTLSVIPLKHFWWHQLCLNAAHAFVWIGFLIAVYHAWRASDFAILALSLMLLGIGLLIFRGVAFFMNTWVILSAYISHREIREAEEIEDEQRHEHAE